MLIPIFDLPWWGYIVVALCITHITIAGVTIYLHRHQAHMSLDLHPVVSHFFRFWIWITTGMETREWIAIHRKHHARVETSEDPHSPQVHGIHKVLFAGAWLYHQETRNSETMEQFGSGAPDDWLERNVYTNCAYIGVIVMLAINVVLFGWPGVMIWLTQMLWIPFWAAGVINGVGHFLGYRNYETADASRNIVPWGLIIGGEELHNNHHAYASSARFSQKPWEFDLGWAYIKILSFLGLAKVRKKAPRLALDRENSSCDLETARAVIGNRVQVMANFTREVIKKVIQEEKNRVKRSGDRGLEQIVRARHLLARELTALDEATRSRLDRALEASPALATVYTMKQRLQAIWNRKSTQTPERIAAQLEEWCKAAEQSGIETLEQFSHRLRRYRLVATAG